MGHHAVRKAIVDWLDDNFHFGDTETLLAGDDEKSFLQNGILDSLGFVKLMLFLEDSFAINIDRKDVRPANFDSLGKIIRYISVLPGFRLPV